MDAQDKNHNNRTALHHAAEKNQGPVADELSALLFSDPGIVALPAKDDSGAGIANTFDVSVGKGVEPGYYEVRLRGLFGISNPRTFRVDTLPEINEAEPNNTVDVAQVASVNQIINARADAAGAVEVEAPASTDAQA